MTTAHSTGLSQVSSWQVKFLINRLSKGILCRQWSKPLLTVTWQGRSQGVFFLFPRNKFKYGAGDQKPCFIFAFLNIKIMHRGWFLWFEKMKQPALRASWYVSAPVGEALYCAVSILCAISYLVLFGTFHQNHIDFYVFKWSFRRHMA